MGIAQSIVGAQKPRLSAGIPSRLHFPYEPQAPVQRNHPVMPPTGQVFLVLTMRAQGPFRHGSGIGPESWRTRPASVGSKRGEPMTWGQWPGSYLKESWSLVR
jgi:hypothetical protein